MSQEFQLYFLVFVKFPVVKTNWENQIGPWRFRGIQGNIYTQIFIDSHYELHYPIFYDQ